PPVEVKPAPPVVTSPAVEKAPEKAPEKPAEKVRPVEKTSIAPLAKTVTAPPVASASPAEVKPEEKQQVPAVKSDRRIEKHEQHPALDKQPKATIAAAPSIEVPEAEQGSSKGLKLALAALAAAALFVALFVYPGILRQSTRTATTPQQDLSPLQLHVERSNGELLLTWNRDSDAIRTATKAVLVISDGEQRENVEMDLAQLRNGSIYYSPQTADISFK